MKNKIKNPIAFQKLIEFYTNDQALAKPRDVVLAEFNDLITITDYLCAKIPYRIKSIRNHMSEYNINMKKINTQLHSVTSQISNLQRQQKLNLNPNLAYDLFCRMSHEQQQIDFKEQFAQKQMKLKFLTSREMPIKFPWKKIFNQKTGNLIFCSKKYQLFIGLQLHPDSTTYRWQLIKIEELSRKKELQYLKQFFDQVMRPILSLKYPEGYEEYSLKYMINLLQFAQLLQVMRYVKQITNKIGSEDKNFKIAYKNTEYDIQFTNPETSEKARIWIRSANNFEMEICFQMLETKCRISYEDTSVFCQSFCLQNFSNMIQSIPKLIDILKRIKKVGERYEYFYKKLKNFLVIKWLGHIWKSEHNIVEDAQLSTEINQQNAYFLDYYQNKLIVLSTSKTGRMLCKNILEQKLNKLIQLLPKNQNYNKFLFSFIYLLRYFQQDCANPDQFQILDYAIKKSKPTERLLQEFQVDQQRQDYQLELRFKRRSIVEEWLFKQISRQYNSQPINLLILTIKFEIDLNLRSMNIKAQNKDSITVLSERSIIPQYSQMIEEKTPNEPMDIEIAIKQINYLRSTSILQKYIDNKYNENNHKIKVSF